MTEEDVNRATFAANFFCLGIWAFKAQMVITRAYFALGDTKTPTRVALCMIALNFLLNLTLVWFLQEGGIALATTLAAIIQGTLLLAILRHRLGPLGAAPLIKSTAVGVLVTLVMVQCGYLLLLIPAPGNPTASSSPTPPPGYTSGCSPPWSNCPCWSPAAERSTSA